jgi:hypothetical protein
MTPVNLSRAAWRKSTRSGQNGNCVEVAAAGPAVAVRDSTDPDGPALVLGINDSRRFAAKVRAGNPA